MDDLTDDRHEREDRFEDPLDTTYGLQHDAGHGAAPGGPHADTAPDTDPDTDSDPVADSDESPPGDADLVAQVREGGDEPYAELYRRHQPAALALARTLTEHAGADDVVSEAFEKLLQRIRSGGGPEAAFRPYLLRTVRTVAVDASRRTRRLVVAEDPAEGTVAPTGDDELVDAVHQRTTLARAFAALPERWQTFLWLSFVDDADRSEIAAILGINLASVSALGYRAREGLRRAYLDAHLRNAPTPDCGEVWPLLAGAVRGGLGPTQQAQFDEHRATCEHCRAAAAELEAVNTRFGAVLAPIVLGAAAPAYLAAVRDEGVVAVASSSGAGGAAAAPAGEAGVGGSHAMVGAKATMLGLGKAGAAGVAVVACVSVVAVVALISGPNSPLSSDRSLAPPAGTTSAGDGSSRTGESDGSEWSGGTGSPGEESSTEGVPSTSGVPSTGVPTDTATTGGPTDPATTGGPTGGPTSNPTGGPTGGPTGNPTGGPTGNPTGGPTSTTTTPTPTGPTGGPDTVDAGLGNLVVEPTSNGSAHVGLPVTLSGGTADLLVSLSVRGLSGFTVTHGAGEGDWGCVATTAMGGASRTAVVQCSMKNASPGDTLRLGITLRYSGTGSVSAVLNVTGDAVDSTSSDNTSAAQLPARGPA